MRELALNKIVYFEAVARHSRVTTAAEELCVSSSAVSQQIKQLEEALGVQLFRRLKRRLVLTEDGKRLYDSSTQALEILRRARQQIARKKENYKFILRVSLSLGLLWLGPRMSQFIESNPLWDIHIDATSELTDFEKENIDLDIRYAFAKESALFNKAIIHDYVFPMCSPEYLHSISHQSDSPQLILQNSRLIHTVKSRISWRSWLRHSNISDVDISHGVRFDRSFMSLECAKNGTGIILESATLAMDDLRSQRLVPAFPSMPVLFFPAYSVVCPTNHVDRNVAKIFIQWIEEEASKHEQSKRQLLASLGCNDIIDYQL